MTVLAMDTTARFNPSTEAVASSVKSTGDWQVADPDSSDPIIAGLSTAADTASQTDPAVSASTLTGEFTAFRGS